MASRSAQISSADALRQAQQAGIDSISQVQGYTPSRNAASSIAPSMLLRLDESTRRASGLQPLLKTVVNSESRAVFSDARRSLFVWSSRMLPAS